MNEVHHKVQAGVPPKILLVDDRPENRVALRRLLAKVDAKVIEASSRHEALTLTLDHDFAVILLDVDMPEMDGYEVSEILRGEERTRRIPIIFVTATYKDDIHRRKGYESGAVDYIEKPIVDTILLSKVGVFLGLYNQAQSLKREIAVNNMVGERRLKEQINDTFGKYMDPRVVTHLLDSPEVAKSGGERREMTVMFIDLQDFTTLSEKLPPDRLVETVNRFFTHMTEAISTNGGVVDKFMGDAVMAFWGAPFTGPDEHAALACRAAAAALEGLGKLRSDAGISDIDFRIGISSGEVIVGTIGSETSRSYTVMGDTVNLGSRLEGANKAYGTHVIMSERTRELAGDGFPIRELDLIRVKGKTEPTRIHQLLGNKLEPQGFQEGLKAYRNQDWEAATRVFETCLTEVPGDPPSRVYLDRVAHLKAHPPERDWNGVWVFSAK